ncbi:hypothetical protein LP416_09915 [Polaromonas sp. P2-4]|nr:hypothetical protein LP416_09915 [Polaromonas sp. P2-4]
MNGDIATPSSSLHLSHDNDVMHAVLNRTDKGNALSADLVAAFAAAVQQAQETEVRLLVISGTGKHFCTWI